MWQPWLSSLLAPDHHYQMRLSVHYKHKNVSQRLQYVNRSHVDGTSQKCRTRGTVAPLLSYAAFINLFLFYLCRFGPNCTFVAEFHFHEWFIGNNRCLYCFYSHISVMNSLEFAHTACVSLLPLWQIVKRQHWCLNLICKSFVYYKHTVNVNWIYSLFHLSLWRSLSFWDKTEG